MKEQLSDDMVAMLTGTISTQGSTSILTTSGTTTSNTTYVLPNNNPLNLPDYLGFNQAGQIINPHDSYESFKEMMDKYKSSANPTTASESLEVMISDMEGSDNELQQNAVKHMRYAKAYLDKIMLDAINERL